MRTTKILIAITALAATAACSPKPGLQTMPEVNDENCIHENIQKLTDKAMQQEFAGKCLRRGTFTPSPPRKWGF